MQEGGDRARPQGARGSGGERPRRVQGRGREGQGRARVLSFEVRPATVDDAEGIAAVVNDLARALVGEDETTASEIRTWFDMPDIVFLVAERPDGQLVGYADFVDQDEHKRFSFDLRIPPEVDRAPEVAAALLDALEARSAELAAPGATSRLFVPSEYELLRRLGEKRGYEPFRHSFQMRIEFAGDLPAPEWPEGISVRTFVPEQDEHAVHEAHQDAFADHFEHVHWPYESWRQWAFIESFDPTLWWVAQDGGDIAGVCLGRYEGYAGPEIGWVNVLGVRQPWRRRGLGRALLLHAFAEFRARGKRGVGLGVDGLNTNGAVRLYEQAGMHVARRFDQYKKLLSA